MRNDRNKNNHKTNRKQRHRNHAVLLKRTALNSHAVASLILPAKSYSPPNRKKVKGASESHLWKPKAASKSEMPVSSAGTSNSMNEKEKTTDTGGKNNLSGTHRWYNNPRITGAVAAVLLFATLAIAIIPTSLSVRAEEQTETAALDPVRQVAKEYIYAGSRMLAIEDYGLSAGTPTPSPTPSLTPTPTPETPTPTPPTPTPTPDTPTPTPDTPTPTPTPTTTPTPTPSLTPTPTPTPNPTPTPCKRRCPTGQVLDLETCTCSGIID